MPFPLPVGHKFSCIALANAGVARELRNPINLGDGLYVLFEPPFALDDTWGGWLGSVQSEYLAKANFVVLAHQPSAKVAVIDAENEMLRSRCLSLLYALFLADVFHHDGGLILSGSNVDGAVNVRQVSRLESLFRPNGVKTVRIDAELIEKSSIIASGIRAMHVPGQQEERLHRGFHGWIQGVMEYYGGERLHQFVRSVEAVVKPSIGKTKRQFIDRCEVFAGNSAGAKTLFRELYELRSLAEHLHSSKLALAGYPQNQNERIELLRSYQAQLLASHVYERIFSRPDLHGLFATDDAIEAFWGLTRGQQIKTWGRPIDIEGLSRGRFIGPF